MKTAFPLTAMASEHSIPIVDRRKLNGQPWTVLRFWVVLAAALSIAWGCREPESDALPLTPAEIASETAAMQLHAAIWSRLALMPSVAFNKFVQDRPITDRGREDELIERFRRQSELRGLNVEFSERVIRAQIEASKVVQAHLHQRWKTHPPSAEWRVRDLTDELRSGVDDATNGILMSLVQLGEYRDVFPSAIGRAYLLREPLPPNVPKEAWVLAWAPLLEAPRDLRDRDVEAPRVIWPGWRSTPSRNEPLMPDFAPESLSDVAIKPAAEARSGP